MSNPAADPASNLPGLFANLRANSSQTQSFAAPSSSPPFQAGVTSPTSSTIVNAPHSRENTSMSRSNTSSRAPASSGAQPGSAQMTNPLLSLLKFSSNSSSPQTTPQQPTVAPAKPEYGSPSTHSVHGRGISASDLVASFTSGKASTPPATREKTSHTHTPSTNHQDALLKLLNRTTAPAGTSGQKLSGSADVTQGSEDTASSSYEDHRQSAVETKNIRPGRKESPVHVFGSKENTPTPFEPQVTPRVEAPQGMFTYQNPFVHLAASSPRNLQPSASPHGDMSKRKIKSPSPSAAHTASRRKLTPSGDEVLQSIESPAPGRPNDGRSQIEALMGIGTPIRDAETVADALNEVGGQVDRQVENALTKAEDQNRDTNIKQEARDYADQPILADVQEQAHDIAVDVKKELDKDENEGLLEESMPKPVAEAVKDVIEEAAEGKVAHKYDTADDEDAAPKEDSDRIVQVYQFPMKPFVSIELIQNEPAHLLLRDDSVVNIARLKKDFDQVDRTLATATNEYIVYGMPKNGGIRIIQQDSGVSHLIFAKTQDRIFNVAISTARSGSTSRGTQTVIATGISGTVYWATIAKEGEDLSEADIKKQRLIIPPLPSQMDSTSGGQLKTRAKKSNRHPEFFAIGRGKSIQIIFSSHAQSSDLVTKDAIMDTEKYFAERSLKIITGKAGKDFTFSEDDTTIVTLDKAGKLRIWDVRDLTNESNASASMLTPVEINSPIHTFNTAHSTEKSWPTSVLLADKLRPYLKGTALRYIIVGMKQNHTLQLWDLCLGKAVQELSFPHEKETDAICSVTYHPASGIIAVGHPTRNSIYFIHLSAPKYIMQSMSQANFVSRLATKDSTLPKAEATAIMSGMREYSFADKGQLRSIELVPSSGEPTRLADEEEDPILFELYVMHSKGVTCLAIKKDDLGWSKDSRVIHSVDAEQEGCIVVNDLRETAAPATTAVSEPSSASVNGDAQNPANPAKAKAAAKEPAKADRGVPDSGEATPKADRKKSKRNGVTESASRVGATPLASETYAGAAQRASTPTSQAPSSTPKESTPRESMRSNSSKQTSRDTFETGPASSQDRLVRPVANGDSISVGISGDFLDKELKKIEVGVSNEFNKVLGRELDVLYRRFAEDKRVQDAAGAAKQDAMLRLVSSTLSENVEKSLSRIIQKNIQDSVVPSIAETTSVSLNDKLSTIISKQLYDTLLNAMKLVLPDAIGRAMQTPSVLRSVSDQITKTMTGHVEKEFSTALRSNIVPAFTNLAVNVAQNVGGDTERRVREQLQHAEMQHREDSIKIDQLTNLVRGLSETVHTMAAAQSDFQLEILKLQQKASQEESQALARRESINPSDSASMHISLEQEELGQIASSMNEGNFEDATVQVCHVKHFRIQSRKVLKFLSGFNRANK